MLAEVIESAHHKLLNAMRHNSGVHMRILMGLACALVLMPSAVAADPPKPTPQEKVICKRVYEADTGSHFTSSKRVCRKSSDWDQLEREKNEAMRTVRDNTAPGEVPSAQGLGSTPQ